MTPPLNRAASAERATYMRVRYPARSPGRTVHRPSRPTTVPGAGSYDWATPSSRNSSITYPYLAASAGLPNGQPLPPVTGPLTVAVLVRCPVVTPAPPPSPAAPPPAPPLPGGPPAGKTPPPGAATAAGPA